MTGSRRPLPRWIDIGLIPVANVVLAFIVAGLIVLMVGVNPLHAVRVMLLGAFGYLEAIGYTLYYATNFVFAGLAVALAFHAGLFNIGGEGQAYVGGLGSALVVLAFDTTLSPVPLIVLAIAAAAAFGAAWALIPAYLQAYRGSHIVITTIMFNFIAAALMVYLLVNVLIAPGSMSPESREFASSSHLPLVHDLLVPFGIRIGPTPLNASIFLALLACVLVWIFLWHTTWGFELRTMGHNADAAVYAGVGARGMTIVAMCLSGALAGLIGVNEILGVHHRLILNFTAGYGFGGIAVALMGRNHPIGIGLASLLFATLYQGGAELALEIPALSHEMIVLIQGLVILFCGALANLTRAWIDYLFAALVPAHDPAPAVAGKS
jgi:general nucleoside transport system permease protein